jgi:hypothetical protein
VAIAAMNDHSAEFLARVPQHLVGEALERRHVGGLAQQRQSTLSLTFRLSARPAFLCVMGQAIGRDPKGG